MTDTEAEIVLNGIYNHLNKKLFSNELPTLPIIATTGRDYMAACYAEDQKPICINVSVDRITGPNAAEDLTAAMLHEMVHEYCILHGIDHYDAETGTHLEGFINEAGERGLFYDDFTNDNFLLTDLETLFYVEKGLQNGQS